MVNQEWPCSIALLVYWRASLQLQTCEMRLHLLVEKGVRSKTSWWFGCHVLFSHMLGMSSSQLTFIFFRGVAQPPTTFGLTVRRSDFSNKYGEDFRDNQWGWHHQEYVNGLVWRKIYRKPYILWWNMGISCTLSLKIHWDFLSSTMWICPTHVIFSPINCVFFLPCKLMSVSANSCIAVCDWIWNKRPLRHGFSVPCYYINMYIYIYIFKWYTWSIWHKWYTWYIYIYIWPIWNID